MTPGMRRLGIALLSATAAAGVAAFVGALATRVLDWLA
jgi:hypothetical protein